MRATEQDECNTTATDDPKPVLTPEEAKSLIHLCRTGRLYEVNDWIASGKSLRTPPECRTSPLLIAINTGFQSLIELLARSDSGEEAKDAALGVAVSRQRMDLIELLLANGADFRSVPLADVLQCWSPKIMRFFLELGADPITGFPFAVAFGARIRTALRVYVEYKQTHPEFASQLQAQADCALRHFCHEGNLKWVSLLMWAGADPRSKGPSLDELEVDDPESHTTGLDNACYCGSLEVLKRLKLDPGRDDLSHLLHCTAVSGDKVAIHYLLELGAGPNDKENGGSSSVDTCLWRLGWGPFDLYDSRRLRRTYDVYKPMECLEELVTHGALWRPNDRGALNSLRKSLFGSEPKVTVNLLQLFIKNGACSEEAIHELLKPPKMSQHLASEVWHLARLQLEPDGRKKAPKPKAASPQLLAHYDREELYEKVWTEPTRTVAKSYGVSDVWLSKICKALKVPVPGRGYWAKKAAGRAVRKRPTLPPFRP